MCDGTGRGGAVETVVDEVTGLFFERQDSEAFGEAMLRFENAEAAFSSEAIRKNALRFDKAGFLNRFEQLVREKVAERTSEK